MSYVKKNLSCGEKISKEAKIHWCIYVFPIVLLLIGGYLSLFLADLYPILGTVFLLFGAIILINAYVVSQTTELAVTDKRVIAKHGFIVRRSIELNLSKVEGLIVDQGFMGRVFDYGTVTISGTGGDKAPFKFISNPMSLRKAVYSEVERVQAL